MSTTNKKQMAYTAPDTKLIEFGYKSVLLTSLNSYSEVEDIDDITTVLTW